MIIIGGSGALGRSIVSQFKHLNPINIDFTPNIDASFNVPLIKNFVPSDILAQIHAILDNKKVSLVVSVAGGWAGGNLASDDFLSNVGLMFNQSVQSSAMAAKLASLHLDMNGLLVLTGAEAALHATPGMIAYGMNKASVHHLVKSCAANGSGMPIGSNTVALLPVTLDTPMNRKWMPDADTSTWTPLSDIGMKIKDWMDKEKPVNGGLYQIKTTNGETKFIV